MTEALRRAEHQHHEATESNRALGVIGYKSGEKQSEQVWEVAEGLKYLPGGKVLGPGHRFHPTERQVRQTAKGKGGLTGKARELSRDEYASIRRDDRKPMSRGADIGIRALPMAEGTLKFALEAGLSETDFVGIEPGFEGRFTKAQVAEIIEGRNSADA
jgi:hypothetical protein